MSFGNLPFELAKEVGNYLDDKDLSSLSRTCRDLHNLFTDALYSRHQLDHELMYYSVEGGNIGAVRYLLEAHASPNIAMSSVQNRQSLGAFPLNTLGPRTSIDLLKPGQPNPSRRGGPRVRLLPNYWTPLHVAASMGRDDMVDLLLQHKAKISVFSKGFCGCSLPNEDLEFNAENHVTPLWTPLHTAICHGHESTARLLLSHGASTNVSRNSLRVTALHTACWSNNAPIIRFLLNEGHQTNINVRDQKGYTPMAYAYYADSWRSIYFLAHAGASLNITLGPYNLVEHACLRSRFYDALRFINLGMDLDKSSVVNLEVMDTASALLFRCCKFEVPQSRSLWKGFRISHEGESDQEEFRTDVIQALIFAGADAGVRCQETMPDRSTRITTPLIVASQYGLDEVVKTLLDAGADIEAVDDGGNTALMMFCRYEGRFHQRSEEAKLSTMTTLLTHKPQSFDNIRRALKTALRCSLNTQMVELLIKHASPGILDDEGSSELLMEALSHVNYAIADFLMESGLRKPTSVEIDSIIAKSARSEKTTVMAYLSRFPQSYDLLRDPNRLLDYIRKGHTECARFMIKLEMPASCEIFLVEACGTGNSEIVGLLLKKGADPNRSSGTDLPLVKAILGNHPLVVRLLLDHGAITSRRDFDALNLAIVRGKKDAVSAILAHPSYRATESERTAYLEAACCASPAAFGRGEILGLILESASPNVVLPMAAATPLHMCIARGQDDSIRVLLNAGANIHMQLGPDDCSSAAAMNRFWGTTPLEWAIKNSPIYVIANVLRTGSFLDLQVRFTLREFCHPRQEAAQLRYIRAACRRYDPEVIGLLLRHEIPLQLRDNEGNSFLMIFCQTIVSIWQSEDPDRRADSTGEKSARCIIALLKGGGDPQNISNPQQKNNEGVSALDYIRRIMTYEGPSHFHQVVAKAWNRELILDDEGVRERG
ncbi:ankyrin [Daldinia vernicosa]|uniref:ankyrin n=1 Tax=Daldinia vernicosa TaxID=114800 RepID=UPI0020080C11|nr:ankyrin [Daldinia vernicosa]KAI0849038.1 ankyrin [Daldinia vernicosa]